ncbi:glycoside hydrolase [Chloroflexia bacterium SDU3-3]|nr:glycoside hydrolase [Chloroflexia bacterium SDU3-3]
MQSSRSFGTWFQRQVSTRVALALGVTLLSSHIAAFSPQTAYAASTVGAGSYTTTKPASIQLPSNSAGAAVTPKRTANVTGPMPTSDWWSSLGFQRYAGNPYSDAMFAYPLGMQAAANGLQVGYATSPGVGNEFHYGTGNALTIGVAGLSSPDAKVDAFSDWTVTGYWSGGGSTLRATFGHGLPFVYATKTGGNAQITTVATPTVFAGAGTNAVGITVNGQNYGLFAPTGAAWSQSGTTFTSGLNGKDYFSVAVLPDSSAATLAAFKTYAYAFVTNTRVTWSYDQASAKLNTTYTATTTAKEGSTTGTIMALLRHQWINSSSVNTSYTYGSARGQMKVVTGSSFSTSMAFNGVLPSLPDKGSYDRNQLNAYVNQVYNGGSVSVGAGLDTYNTGKQLWRLAALVPIADQLGNTAAKNAFLAALKTRLQDWLQGPDGKASDVFYYNSTWGTLIGAPAGFGSDSELNDHHFHYGYYILAAAIVAQYDQSWASDSQWGGMIKLLIRDSNSWDHSDSMFPFLRTFDPYAGHSWASGHAGFGAGNNQESSSEAMMFNTAVLLFGANTGNTTIRDLGIYLYTTEMNAIEQYWMDVDNTVFPSAFSHNAVGMVWGDGGAHATWFSGEPEMIHGINFLPITGGSLYLGRRPSYVTANYNEIVSENGGTENDWVDVMWSYQALANPSAALAKFGSGGYTPFDGETKAHTYHWLHNLNAMGQVDTTVTANIPTYAVFNKGGTRTYVAYNPSGSATTVTFSNGVTLAVSAWGYATSNGSGGPTATPVTPTPVTPTPVTPTATPVTPTPVTPTPVTPTTTPTTGSNLLYLIDGASTSVNGALSLTPGGGASSDSIPSAGGTNHDGTPTNALTYVASGLSGSYDSSKATGFALYLDAGTGVGNGTQARVSYDFTGDGSYDRVETYNYFALDPVSGDEQYTQGLGLKSASGSFANLSGGKVKVEIWNAIGSSAVNIRTSATSAQGYLSNLLLPYGSLSTGSTGGTARSNLVYVIDGAANGVTGSLSFSPGGGASSDSIPSAGGTNHDGTPTNALTYVVSGVTGTYDSSKATGFALYVDAGTGVGVGTQARVSYDFTGDGSYDRVETYYYFALNAASGDEEYTQGVGLKSATGSFANLSGGKIKLEVWNAIGGAAASIRTSASSAQGYLSNVLIPFTSIYQ